MHHMLIDQNQFPTPSMIFLLDLMGVAHDYSLNSIIRVTQERWLQPSKERWHFESNEEHRLHYIFPFLYNLGCVDAIFAQSSSVYDYALIFGGYYTRMQNRIAHLVQEWERGIRFRKIVLLTGERFLDPELEAPLFNLSAKNTETELMISLWNKIVPEGSLKNTPLTLVDTPGYRDKEGIWRRPTTKDTLLKWFSFSPNPGKCLFISSQPFIGYQNCVINTYLPTGFSAETVGAAKEKDLPLSVYLDNLARWLYQHHLWTRSAK